MTSVSCFFLGDGIVALNCVEIAREQGFDVRGAFSSDGSLREACERLRVEHLSSREELRAALVRRPYDWLFSVNNGWVLPREVIATATRGAINYHDSLLPKYAGLHATSWALLHGERDHGVSWHQITATLDGGDLFAQQPVAIDEFDTALTLNAKCFEAAISSFAGLGRELLLGASRPIPQPATSRSYFGARVRPDAVCIIDFEKPAHAIANLLRALDFGPLRNPLGLGKVFVRGAFMAVSAATVHAESSGAPPGTALRVSDEGVRLATGTTDVTLRGFRTLGGAPIVHGELVARFGVKEGEGQGALGRATADAITAFYAKVCTREPSWVLALTEVVPITHPYTAGAPRSGGGPAMRLELPAFSSLLASTSLAERGQLTCAIFAAYAARIAADDGGHVGFSGPHQRGPNALLFAPVVPLPIVRVEEESFDSFAKRIALSVERLDRDGTYATDLFARHPALRDRGAPEFRWVLAAAASRSEFDPGHLDADLIFVAYADGAPPELFHRAELASWQADAIRSQLVCLARAAVAHPETPVADLPLLDDDDRRKILVEWNDTAAPFPDATVHGLFVAQASRTPEAPAVRFGGESLSYRETDRRSSELAAVLAQAGVQRGDVVAICLPRSTSLVVGLLSILKAGAAYVPIDPSYPEGRVAHMMSDSRARVVLTTRTLERLLFADVGAAKVCLDDLPNEPAVTLSEVTPADVRVSDLAYVIYTSGSTGTPKGVEISHRSLVNHSWAISNNYVLGPGDRMLCSASISFDVAGEQIYPALFRGAEVVVRPDDLFDSFTGFDRFVRDEAITAMVLPTAFWHEWVRELERTSAPLPSSLRAVSTGTEKVVGEYLAAWLQMSAGRVRFFQGYGPTETTVTCTMYTHDASDFDRGRAVPIGRPLPNTEIYILDKKLQPLPVGIPGEIFVGGVGLARSYRYRPELTDEKFVPHPWKVGARLYRSGDLGWWNPDGQIVYGARSDFQVKIRGFRVELGEIESALRAAPGVSDAVVVVREDGLHKRLVAYVVAGGELDVEGARAHVAGRLPEYMVPAVIMKLAAFPKTANQKVDRRALPPPPSPTGEKLLPATDLERQLAAVWARTLRVAASAVGLRESFFDLGGDSLRAVSMLSVVEVELGRSVPLSVFAQEPTLEGLAKRLSPSAQVDEERLAVVVQRGDASRPPLWLIHPVGGHVVSGNWLRAGMSPNQPIRGIQSRGLDGMKAPLETVEQMADLYVEIVRASQPRGPYFIAGPSMGGYIAIEMAERLLDGGEEVRLIVMLDTYGPDYPRPTSRAVRLADNVRALASVPTWGGRKEKLREFLSRGGAAQSYMPNRYDALRDISPDSARARSSIVRAIETVTRANERANMAYVPRPFRAPVLLLRAEHSPRWSGMRFDHPSNGWGPIARGGVRVVGVACEHKQLADEPPPEVGRAVQRAIDGEPA